MSQVDRDTSAVPGQPERVELSDLAAELIGGRPAVPVWSNQIGAVTWRVEGLGYLKVGPLHPEFDPLRDAARYRWLAGFVPVPAVLDAGRRDGWGWLTTAPAPGRWALAGLGDPGDDFGRRPEQVVAALGRAVRRFHDAVPVDGCPWQWSASERLAAIPGPVRRELGPVPPIDPVVCHGDTCAPNFQLSDDLEPAAYLDCGDCGVGDRWADIVPGAWSIGYNFGGGHDGADLVGVFLTAYGIGRDIPDDPAKRDWYTRLRDAEG